MKILMIISNLNVGGAEMVLLNLVTPISKRHQIEVISMRGHGPIGERLRALGITIHYLNMSSLASTWKGLIKLLSVIKKFRREI